MTLLLEIANLHVAYGKMEAVQDVSVSVHEGQIVTIVGPNGAGKTTLLNAVAGLLPSRGKVRFRGEDLRGLPAEERVRRGLSLVPERRELFPSMSVEDNLLLGAFSWNARRRTEAFERMLLDVYARFPRLSERRQQAAATLSGGERQMLALGRALMSRPKLLMLDEPSLGLAPRIVIDILRTIQHLRETGVSILLVEQNARAALRIADYAYIFETGKLVLEGESKAIAEDGRVVETYLGVKRQAVSSGREIANKET